MKKVYTKEEKSKLVAQGEVRLGLKFFHTPEVVSFVLPLVVKAVVVHEDNCMCEVCFTIRLDQLVISSEKSLNDMKSSLSRRIAAATALITDENPYTEPFEAAVINVSMIKEYVGNR